MFPCVCPVWWLVSGKKNRGTPSLLLQHSSKNNSSKECRKKICSTLALQGMVDHFLPTNPTCGKLLEHCKDKVLAFREGLGIRLAVFKIGVTASPSERFPSYMKMGFTGMWLIAKSDSIDLVHMLEAALISEYHQHVGCRNKKGSGGDGALNRRDPSPPPYYVYVVGGRADQMRRVG